MRKIIINEKLIIPECGLFLIAGPCVIESEAHTLFIAEELKKISITFSIPVIFKASFDKANRHSVKSYRGPGLEKGLEILKQVKKKTGLPILSDVHEVHQIEKAQEVLDVIQIPAFLCRQTDLVVESARTQKPLNIKKGQFMAPWNMLSIVEKSLSVGNEKIIITERGTTFGYNNLVVDMRSIPIMKDFGFPIVIDATHSVQTPGGAGDRSGGDSRFAPYIAKAGVSVGADGVFIEVHEAPERALSDGPNSLPLSKLPPLIKELNSIYSIVHGGKS
ncbi:MAG: 3-deoxy-8-phosphooctulonate synthase [Candidatus Aminicenantia bacterium]